MLWEFQFIKTDNLQKLDAETAVLIWMQGCCIKQPACSVCPTRKPEVLAIIHCSWWLKPEIQLCRVTRLGPFPNHNRMQDQVKHYLHHRPFYFSQLDVVVNINTSMPEQVNRLSTFPPAHTLAALGLQSYPCTPTLKDWVCLFCFRVCTDTPDYSHSCLTAFPDVTWSLGPSTNMSSSSNRKILSWRTMQ